MTPCPVAELLAPDNFTPVARTPWGGTRLRSGIKASCEVRRERADQLRIGESWEVSVEPDFPAQIASSGETLRAWLERHGERALGEEATRGRNATALLVKLLDTDQPLSLQIHPSDDFSGLAADEAGKPESWYVVHAEPGAGLYLGFNDGVGTREVREALSGAREFLPLLRFVPVAQGDFFRIDAGTPHAVGAGLTLVEPQHVLPGRRGLTYRYWDWDRRYDVDGRPAADGTPRALHIAEALAVTRWDHVAQAHFVDDVRHRAGAADREGPALLEALCGATGALPSDWLQVWRAQGNGLTYAPDVPFLRSLTVLGGSVGVRSQGETLLVQAGHSAVLPACAGACELWLSHAHAVLASVA